MVGLTPTQEALLTLVWGEEDQGLARRRAIWLLWEDDDTTRSRHRLSQLLHEIRVRLSFDPVAVSAEDVLLPAWGVVPSDVAEYRAALRGGSLQKALVLEERGFAARLKRVPGEEFDDWLVAKRARLRRELREAAARAWDTHQPNGAWRLARDAAEVLHVLDRQNESALRNVVEARAMCGGFEAAEAAFAAFVDGLEDRAALDPETSALIDRVRRLSGEREIGPPRDTTKAPPLVGRQEHLRRSRAVLDALRGGGFHFLLLQGDSGVGKTRLLDEVRREAHIKGLRCLQARSAELERHIPLSPLIDALSHADVGRRLRDLEDPWRAVIAALLPHLPEGMQRPEVPPIAESSLSRRLYDAFSILFTQIAEDEPTVLFLDDLQWADATTVAVLQFVQRRWRSGSMAVICTLRPDLVAGGDGVEKYLEDDEDLRVTRLTLAELDERDAMQLVSLVADGTLDEATTVRLCRLAGGNPFYLVELTKDYLAGHLQLPELPSDALTIPISLRQLVEPRLGVLSESASKAASFLAIWGRWARLFDLAALTRTAPQECIADVEELERGRLVVVDRDQVRIAHELFRGALYHRLGETRRAVLHRMVAEHLLSLEQPQPGELAIHFGRAGDDARAARFGREAADAALENGAMAEAAHFLQVVTENESDERLKAEATADLARVLHMKRDIAKADPLLELAATRLRAVGNPARALRMDIRRVEGLAEIGDKPVAELLRRLESIKAAARRSQDDEAWALALDSELHLLNRVGMLPEIRDLFTEIRACGESKDPTARCLANAALSAAVLFGDQAEALDAARRSVRLAEDHGLDDYRFLAHMRLFVALFYMGLSQSTEAEGVIANARALAERSGDVVLRFQLESNYGVAQMDAGHFDEAALHFERAAETVAHAEDAIARCHVSCNRGELAFLGREFPTALRHFREAAQILGENTMPADIARIVGAGVGLGALEAGDLGEARRREAETLPVPDDWHFDPFIFLSFHARLLERRGKTRDAVALLREHAATLHRRMPNAWLKLLIAEVRMSRRARIAGWEERASEGIALAERLRFTAWSRELERLLGGTTLVRA